MNNKFYRVPEKEGQWKGTIKDQPESRVVEQGCRWTYAKNRMDFFFYTTSVLKSGRNECSDNTGVPSFGQNN